MAEPYLEQIKPFHDLELPSPLEQTVSNLLLAQGNQQIGNLQNLAVGLGNTGMYMDPGTLNQTGALWLGGQQQATAPFSVDMKGNLIATKATVSGAITGATIDIGSGNNSFHVDINGNMWLGNTAFASAPFSVTNGGALKATSGAIAGWTIGNTTLTNNNITLDSGGTIFIGTTADGILLTTSSGQGLINFYLSNALKATLRATSSHSGGVALVSGDFLVSNNFSYLMQSTSSSDFGRIGVANDNGMLVILTNPADGGASAGEIRFENFNQTQDYFHITDGDIFINANTGDVKLNGKYIRVRDQGFSSSIEGGGNARLDWEGGQSFRVSPAPGNNISVNGNAGKPAVVETSKGYNALYAIEAPGVWFMDFCPNMNEIDPMFLEVTEGPMHFIDCENGGYQVWRRRKGYSSVRFDPRTKEQFVKNNKFWTDFNKRI